jgi:hypothetical protein
MAGTPTGGPTGAAPGTTGGFTIGSKEALDNLRNIAAELKGIVELSKASAKIMLSQANFEKSILEDTKSRGLF